MTLEISVRADDLAASTALLRAGADVNRRGQEGLTPLMIASGLGLQKMVELLLAAGADVLALEPRMGATALHKAAQSGNAEILRLLLDHGSFIDQQSPIIGHTSLMDAVLHKQEAAVRLLLERGAKTKLRNHWQQTAIELARDNELDAIARLIELRDEADAEQIRAMTLIAAIKAGDVNQVKQLIAAGAPVNQRVPMVGNVDDSYTPLGIAAREGLPAIARLLLDAGADRRQTTGLMQGTAGHEAAYFGHADVLRVLTDSAGLADSRALEIDAQGPYNGFTALHDAVWHGHVQAAQALVDAGARLDLMTHAGLTPRQLALLYGYADLARLLGESR